MDQKAERLLRALAEKQTPNRWPALYLLASHAYRQSQKISGSMLTAHLLRHAVTKSDAERFGAEFDHYIELLTMHDRVRA